MELLREGIEDVLVPSLDDCFNYGPMDESGVGLYVFTLRLLG